MRRLLFLALCVIMLCGLQIVTNCSRPLDTYVGPNDPRSDTIFDTVFVIDTIGDTIIVVDTIVLVDSIVVIQIDTIFLPMNYCAQLSSGLKEIVWMLQNSEGEYELELLAAMSEDCPPQTLIVEIDGELIEWCPLESAELNLIRNLDSSAITRIYSNSPHAFGHAIDICLKVNPL